MNKHWRTKSKWWYILYIAQGQALEHKRNDFKLLAKEEDLPVTENEEQKFWELGLWGCSIQFIIITESYLGLAAVNIAI